uniref:Uncharacterized protein n=1 Tax=Anguilla anguilla TaxID=7936 RepID=A0A0E9U8Y0_ANGAN
MPCVFHQCSQDQKNI